MTISTISQTSMAGCILKANFKRLQKCSLAANKTSEYDQEMPQISQANPYTVLPANSDSDVVFCLHLLSKPLTCTLHLS